MANQQTNTTKIITDSNSHQIRVRMPHLWGWSKSYLKNLNSIHQQGMRFALDAYTTSPTESLYIEVNDMPLILRRQNLALQYYTKLHSCPSNATYKCVFYPQCKNLYFQKETGIKPFGHPMENLTKVTQVYLDRKFPWLLKQSTI